MTEAIVTETGDHKIKAGVSTTFNEDPDTGRLTAVSTLTCTCGEEVSAQADLPGIDRGDATAVFNFYSVLITSLRLVWDNHVAGWGK